MSDQIKLLYEQRGGARALTNLYHQCTIRPPTPEIASYVCLKENHIIDADFKGALVTGRFTNKFLLSMGLQPAAQFLNTGRPSWLFFTADHYGVSYVVVASPEMMERCSSLGREEEALHLPFWEELALTSTGRPSHHPGQYDRQLSSFGSRCRKHHLDCLWAARVQTIVVDHRGVCFVDGVRDRWMTITVTFMLRYRARTDDLGVFINWMQPRWIVTTNGSEWVATINKSLLALAGDVESNPGPSFRAILSGIFCFTATCFVLLHIPANHGISDVVTLVHDAPGVITFLLDKHVVQRIDQKAYDCAVIMREHDAWLQLYEDPLFVQMHYALGSWSNAPSHASLGRKSYACHLAHYFVGVPDVPEFTHTSIFVQAYHVLKWLATWMAVLWIGCCCLAACCTLFYIHRKGKVCVVNPNGKVNINLLRRDICEELDSLKPPKSSGGHEWLATQRRSCEAACINWMLRFTKRFRDVGGSRTRWPHLGFAKHVCCPTFSNDDILRDLKGDTFENCGQFGEACPRRRELPFAMLCHVDYHMTQQQMVACITGPTFIINHDFSAKPAAIGAVGNKFEAHLEYTGSQLTMRTSNGTEYHHSYHDWKTEGCVVTQQGAFVYTRLTKSYDTCIYFAYPAAGIYSRDGFNTMQPASDRSLPMIGGYKVVLDLDAADYRFTCGRDSFSFAAGVIEEISTSYASCKRDEKYAPGLLNHVTARMKSLRMDTSRLDHAVRLCAYLADVKAVTLVPFATCLQGHPVDFRRLDLYKMRVWIWLSHYGAPFIRSYASRVANSAAIEKYAKWTFPHITVPVYEIYTSMNKSKFIDAPAKKFGIDRFPASPTPANARGARHLECCTGEDNCECDHFTRNAGSKHGPTPTAPPLEQSGGRPGIYVHAGSPESNPPLRPVDDRHTVGGHESNPTNSKERGDSNQPGRPPAPEHRRGDPEDQHVSPNTPRSIQRPERDLAPVTSSGLECASEWVRDGDNITAIATDRISGLRSTTHLDVSIVAGLMESLSEHDEHSFLIWVDTVLSKLMSTGQRISVPVVVRWLCRAAGNGELAPDKRVLKLHGCSLLLGSAFDIPQPNDGAYGFRDMAVTVSREAPRTIARSTNEGETPWVDDQASDCKKLSKGGGVNKRHGSKKH
nr:MAG: methyltransferase [Chemarfal virus 153]